MANETNKLKLIKPLEGEFYDVEVFNENADILDAFADDIDSAVGDVTTLTTTSKEVVGAINELDSEKADNSDIGNRTYTEQNVVTSGESVTESIDKLDIAVADKAPQATTYTKTEVDASLALKSDIPTLTTFDETIAVPANNQTLLINSFTVGIAGIALVYMSGVTGVGFTGVIEMKILKNGAEISRVSSYYNATDYPQPQVFKQFAVVIGDIITFAIYQTSGNIWSFLNSVEVTIL